MARRKKSGKKNTKSKAKEKKQLVIGPKLRLEPRLTPKDPKKNEDKQETEDSLESLSQHTIFEVRSTEMSDPIAAQEKESSSQAISELKSASPVMDSGAEIGSDSELENEASDVLNKSSSVEENENYKLLAQAAAFSMTESEEDEEWEDVKKTKKRSPRKKRLVRNGLFWDDKELMDIATGLQSEGFSDLKKVADIVQTKNENEIHVYLRRRILEARKSKDPAYEKRSGRPSNKFVSVSPENIKTWPNARKWRKLAYDQMFTFIRGKDHSKTLMSALCKKFYEEEKEPTDPQVINVKLIYKYLTDCMSGVVPPQLPPKESALVLDLLRELRSMPIVYDFEEELKFLRDFKEATKFRPFEVKDEFKKRFKKAHDPDAMGPNTVSVPESVFMELSRHKRLVQSFNPLVTPVWMLQKEQEFLEKYFEESNVYVD